MECSYYDDNYRYYMIVIALPVFIFYIAALPAAALIKLGRSDKGSEDTVGTYGFLYSGYKPEYWYWEGIVLLRKILIAGISVFLSAEVSSGNELQVNSSQYQQGLLATLVISVSLYIQLKLEPYENDVLNGIEALGLVVGVLSLYLGLWTFRRHPVIDLIVTVLVFVINGGWLIHTLISLFKEYKVVKFIKSIFRFITCQKKKEKQEHDSKVYTDPHIAITRAGASSRVLVGKKEASKQEKEAGSVTKGPMKDKGTPSQGKEVVNPLSLGVEMTTVTKRDTSEVMNPLSALTNAHRKEHGKKSLRQL